MCEINWDKINQSSSGYEVSRIVETFDIGYPRGPKDLRIEILKSPSGQYRGKCNYEFWGPDQVSPNRTSHFKNNIEDAFNCAISVIRTENIETYPDNVIFWLKQDPFHLNNKIYIDGNGHIVNHEEAQKRRNDYNRNNQK